MKIIVPEEGEYRMPPIHTAEGIVIMNLTTGRRWFCSHLNYMEDVVYKKWERVPSDVLMDLFGSVPLGYGGGGKDDANRTEDQ